MRIKERLKALEAAIQGGGGATTTVGPVDLTRNTNGSVDSTTIPLTKGKLYSVQVNIGSLPKPSAGTIFGGPHSTSAVALVGSTTAGDTGSDGVSGQSFGLGTSDVDLTDAAGAWLISATADGSIKFRLTAAGGAHIAAEDVELTVKEL